MTLCIALHCVEGRIIGISDRMISRIPEYGPAKTNFPANVKAFAIHHSILSMFAGGASISAEIARVAATQLAIQFGPDPKTIVAMGAAARTYRDSYLAVKLDAAQAAILPDFLIAGPTEYRNLLPNMDKRLRKMIMRRIRKFDLDPNEEPGAIVLGIDTQPHIFYMYDGRIDNHNPFGFAVCGSGGPAAHDFLHEHQAWHRPFGQALVLGYIAARLSENPDLGVGPPADIFVLGPRREDFFFVEQIGMWRLAHIYDATFVRNLGGVEIALGFGEQLKPDPTLGLPMPPPPPQNQEEGQQSLPESTHDR